MEHDLLAIRLSGRKETGGDGGRCLFGTMLLCHISSYCWRESKETYVKLRTEYQVKAGNRNEPENSVMFLLS